MKFTVTGRRGGKTTKMVTAFKSEPDAIMLVHSEAERTRIIGEFRLDRSMADRIFTLERLRSSRGRRINASKLLVDNLDLVLWRLLDVSPTLEAKELWVSATGEMKQPKR